jgi:hypothetical protein
MLPPSNWIIRFGKTGAIIPNARKSSVTVITMKIKVAFVALAEGPEFKLAPPLPLAKPISSIEV